MARIAVILAKLAAKAKDGIGPQKMESDDILDEYAMKSCVKRIATLLKGDVVDSEELAEEFTRLHQYQHSMMESEESED